MKRAKSFISLKDHDIVLTTYHTLVADWKKHRVLYQTAWFRVVLDEGSLGPLIHTTHLFSCDACSLWNSSLDPQQFFPAIQSCQRVDGSKKVVSNSQRIMFPNLCCLAHETWVFIPHEAAADSERRIGA
jgi:hypothetical protein